MFRASRAVGNAIATLIATAAFAAHAGPYGPFAPDEHYTIELHACANVLDIRQDHPPLGTIDFTRSDSERRLRITMVGGEKYEAQVFSRDAALGARVNVNLEATMPFDVGLEDAICDDLNRDGAQDFVVTFSRHGNGLGASFYDRLIALSAGDHYRFWVVPTMGPAHEDFVTFGQIEPIVLVTREFFQRRDWRAEPRSYFIYDLWAFRGDEVVIANSIDSRFPKWVRYTIKPNWKPALSISADDKRLSGSDPRAIESVP